MCFSELKGKHDHSVTNKTTYHKIQSVKEQLVSQLPFNGGDGSHLMESGQLLVTAEALLPPASKLPGHYPQACGGRLTGQDLRTLCICK